MHPLLILEWTKEGKSERKQREKKKKWDRFSERELFGSNGQWERERERESEEKVRVKMMEPTGKLKKS